MNTTRNKTARKPHARKKVPTDSSKAPAGATAKKAYENFVALSKEYSTKSSEAGFNATTTVFPPQNKLLTPRKPYPRSTSIPKSPATTENGTAASYTARMGDMSNTIGSAVKMGIELITAGMSAGLSAMGGLSSFQQSQTGGTPPSPSMHPSYGNNGALHPWYSVPDPHPYSHHQPPMPYPYPSSPYGYGYHHPYDCSIDSPCPPQHHYRGCSDHGCHSSVRSCC